MWPSARLPCAMLLLSGPGVLGGPSLGGQAYWQQRPVIVQQLSALSPGEQADAGWGREFEWDALSQRLYRRSGDGPPSQRCLSDEAELHALVKRLACSPSPMTAPAIVDVLTPFYWPVELPLVRQLLARGGICRSDALRSAYSAYVARHNAAIAAPRNDGSRFIVYRICCGQLGNRIQSLVAAFVLALLSERTLLVDWESFPGLSNETVADMFQVPKGLTAWEANPVLRKFSQEELGRQTLHLQLHHAQFERGWNDLLCANLSSVCWHGSTGTLRCHVSCCRVARAVDWQQKNLTLALSCAAAYVHVGVRREEDGDGRVQPVLHTCAGPQPALHRARPAAIYPLTCHPCHQLRTAARSCAGQHQCWPQVDGRSGGGANPSRLTRHLRIACPAATPPCTFRAGANQSLRTSASRC